MSAKKGQFLLLTACAVFIYAVCAGFRDNYGLLLPYICAKTGLGYATVSFVIALGQLFFGMMQPVFGYLALRLSNRMALLSGCSMMLSGLALIPFSNNAPLLAFSLGILLPSGTAGASFGILMSALSTQVDERQANAASGFIAGGIGMSICLLSPVLQATSSSLGLNATIAFLCFLCVLLVPTSCVLTTTRSSAASGGGAKFTFRAILKEGFKTPAWIYVTVGFFTCGFHMALIQTHLFSQLTKQGMAENMAAIALSIYGIGVICGTVGSGFACGRFPMGKILGVLYLSRCVWVFFLLFSPGFLFMLPLIFALGMTGVATLPPTAGLIGKIFGPLKLATLFGLSYFAHQIGAFCSAWAGGICLKFSGSYDMVWQVNICFCLIAGICCLMIHDDIRKAR